jgi:hypothetical protein
MKVNNTSASELNKDIRISSTSDFKSSSLLSDAENFNNKGFHPLPIVEKEPLKGSGKWTDRKGTIADRLYLQKYFGGNIQSVNRVAILLDSIKLGFAIDIDGAKALDTFQKKIVPRLSTGLQNKIENTTHTKSPNGHHWLFEISRQDFPKGIKQDIYWIAMQSGHTEIKVIGTNQYIVERGIGYKPIRGIKSLVTLSKREADELLSVLDRFNEETEAIKKAGSKLVPYWTQPKRHDIALYTAGYLYKNGIPKYLACELMEHIIDIAGLSDDSISKTLQRIEDTYAMDLKTESVGGYTYLLEVVDGDESVITMINQEFTKLGYHFNSNGNGYVRKDVAIVNSDTVADQQEDKKQKTVRILFEIVEENIEQLFKDQFNNVFSAVRIDGHIETVPVTNNGKFRIWVYKIYYETQGELMTNTDALIAVCTMLQSKAYFGKKTIELGVRASSGNGLLKETFTIYYDLTNNDWEQVEITPHGWSIKKSTDAPTIFRRHANHLPQVYPTRDHPANIFEQFMELINATVRDKDGNVLTEKTRQLRLLLKCYIISLFIPEIPKAALMLHGDEGGAKTALQELIKCLVDPSMMLTLTFPQNVKELIQQLSHNYLAFYDNVNKRLPDWVSDLLCRVITGSGFSKRMLYTDDEDVIYNIIRCVGINGVNLAATKADLLDRSLIIRLSRLLKKHTRKLRDDIWPEFERMKSQLLGFIFDILVKVLKVKRDGGIVLDCRSRMADWEEYAEIIARCMGYNDMEFIKAYEENKNIKTETVLADSPVAQAIIKLVESSDFIGRASQLLQKLEPIAQELGTNTKGKTWPKSASTLSRKLNELKTNLLESGIQVYTIIENTRTKVSSIVIHKMPPDPPDAPDNSNQTEMSGGIEETKDQMSPEIPPEKTPENRAQDQVSGGSGGSGGIYSNTLEKAVVDPKLKDRRDTAADTSLHSHNASHVSHASQVSQMQPQKPKKDLNNTITLWNAQLSDLGQTITQYQNAIESKKQQLMRMDKRIS